MTLSNFFSEAIRLGLINSTDVIRDLSALLKASEAKETDLLSNIKSGLAIDITALAIVDKIETESKKAGLLPFGPVLIDTPGYIERLIIFVEVEGLKNYPDGIIDFVRDSLATGSHSLLELFEAAEKVDENLSIFSKKLTWRQEVIPCLLQQTFSDVSLVLELASAASGVNKLPTGWEKVELWVSEHLKKTQLKLPGASSANDRGFFTRLQSDYQPIATHPLVLRILREPTLFSKEKNSDLVEVSADEVRLKFSEWLVNSVFDRAGLLQDLPPECAFASGAFILEMARRNGISVESNGEVTPSGNDWANLANRVLETIVLNSENTSEIPSTWKNQQSSIRNIINVCPEWKLTEVLLNLRSRATQRLTANLDELIQKFSQQTSIFTDTQFLPDAEKFTIGSLPDLRPSIPIPSAPSTSPANALDNLQNSGGGWKQYITSLRDRKKADDDLSNFSNSTQAIVEATAVLRQNFEDGIVSPFVESSLIEQRIEKKATVTNLAIGTYLDRCIANLALDKLESADVSQPWQPFENQSAWKNWINKTSSANSVELLRVWASYEAWDGLRGRLLKLEKHDLLVSTRLYEKAREWLVAGPDSGNVDEWRPRLAAIAHLGIPVDDPLFKDFTDRLEAVVTGGGILGQPLEPLLIAARFELGITAIAINTQPASAFSAYLGDLKNQRGELLRCINVAIKSSNAWEMRAGFNMLILLARLAESTGDLYLRAILYNAFTEPLVKSLIGKAVSEILGTKTSELSGLPLALAAFDLTRSARESSQAIALGTIINLPWVGQVSPPTTSTQIANELTKRLIAQGRSAFKSFASEGGLAAKNLVLALFQIKLDKLQFEQQLTAKPLRTSDPAYVELENLKRTMRSLFCGEQLLLNKSWKADTVDEIVPWWQAQYWFNRLTQDRSTSIIPDNAISTFVATLPPLGETLDKEKLPSSILTVLDLDDSNVMVRVQHWDDRTKQGVQWLLIGQKAEREYVRILKKNDGGSIAVYQIATPFCLFNWSASYNSNAETSLLSQAAVLEAAVPDISEQSPLDIDGFYEGEFPRLSWKAAKEDLERAVKALEEAEGDYKEILEKQESGDRTDEIINLLKQPLRLNTADYTEQMLAAIADVRQAEAELESAEQESLASNFEVFANEYIYEASKVEVERQGALEDIQKFENDVTNKEAEISIIEQRIASDDEEIKQKSVDITIKRLEQAEIRRDQVKRARGVILEEIKLLKKLLDDEFPDPFTPGKKVKGQIGVMARQVEQTLINQLREDLKKAEAELDKAIDAERERQKKAKRRRLINGICRFVGAVVGSIYGGPAGAALGAEIGGAIAELTNGIIDNKPPEQILTGLIDNGFAIAQAAGYDLEKELNTLGAKTAEQAGQFFNQLDASLQPLLDSMPNIFDEQLVSDAIKILDLGEIEGLEPLLKSSYADLKKDVDKLGTLGTALKNAVVPPAGTKFIKVDDPKQLLDRLSDKLFQSTTGDLAQLKALAKSVGEKVENLENLSDQQKKDLAELAAGRLSKLLVSHVGQESINYRRDVITKWINSKRVLKDSEPKFWNDPTVQKEAKALVAELFQDVKARDAALDNIKGALVNPKAEQGRMRAQIQAELGPWQAELDVYLAKVTAVDKNASAPSNAVEAAQANVNYLKNAIKQFDDELIPFLKGDKGTKRNELIEKLEAQVRAAADKTDDLDIQTIETDISKLTVAQAAIQLKQVKDRVEAIKKAGEIADIRVSQSSIETKVVQLSKLRETDLQEAQKNTLEAANARREASKARVKAAKAHLDSKQALAEGANKRGAEASRIRVLLSQPPLRLFDESQVQALETANARRKHAEALSFALKAYREQLRYFSAFQGREPKLELDRRTWSEILKSWVNTEVSNFSTSTVPSAFSTLRWKLTPEQVASLFSSSGFRVVVGPQVPESEDFPIFSVSETWTALLTKEKAVIPKDSPWRDEFLQHGIVLANNAESIEETTDEKWKIVNYRQNPVSVVTYSTKGERVTWDIPLNTEPTVVYSVRKKGGQLSVTRRQAPPEDGRSPYNNYFFDFLPAVQASKARIIGVVLSGKIGASDQPLSTNDYSIEIEHMGDTYTSNKTVVLHKSRKLSTNRFRWLDDDTMTPAQAIKEIQDLSAIDGDNDPFRITGTPLSGTTVIRLIPNGQYPFFNLEIQIVWKYYS